MRVVVISVVVRKIAREPVVPGVGSTGVCRSKDVVCGRNGSAEQDVDSAAACLCMTRQCVILIFPWGNCFVGGGRGGE